MGKAEVLLFGKEFSKVVFPAVKHTEVVQHFVYMPVYIVADKARVGLYFKG